MGCKGIEELENAVFVPQGMNESPKQRLSRLRSAYEMARDLLDKDQENDRVLTLMGIAMYFISKEAVVPAADANFPLEEAIRINPQNNEAVLYLGYSYFDTSKFGEALAAFNKFKASSAYESAFVWLQLKVDELILAARIRLEPGSVTCSEVMALNARRLQCDGIDRPEPVELLAALNFEPSTDGPGEEDGSRPDSV